MDKLNVCLINDSFPPLIDGVSNAVCNYAEIITRELGRATVVTPYYPDTDDSGLSYPVVRYPSVDMTKAVGYRAGLPFSPDTAGTLKNGNFDIIHTHCPITSTFLARALREQIHAPIVFTYHTKFDIDIANAVHGHLLQEGSIRLLVENISACDEVWTVSRGAGENLRSLGYQGDYRVMPNGVDLPRGRVSDGEIAAVTEGWDLPQDVPVFLFVGRMMWYKGIRLILDALAALHTKNIPFRMVFVGGGSDKDAIEAYCASLGLRPQVFFVPPIHSREVIRAWYCRADLFLFPSTFDTNGLVVHEAAATGLASVLIRGSCAAEDVADGVNGFLTDDSAEALGAVLEKLCQRKTAMRRVGENACRDLYQSWEESVSAAYRRYGEVLENYRAGRCPTHNTPGDETIRAIAQCMTTAQNAKTNLQTVREELRTGSQDLNEAIRREHEKIQKLWESAIAHEKENIRQRVERFL